MQVYADNAATTRMSDKAVAAMTPYFQQFYGNPSSLHTVGQQAAEALADARRRVADCLGCSFKEITFTSGGSEADNQAIVSAARIGERKGKKHIISTAFEHHAVLHTLKKLEKEGFEVELLPVGSKTFIPHVLEFYYLLNDGMSFSMLSGKRTLLVIVTGVMLAVLAGMLLLRKMPRLERAAWILVVGGGVGNLIDRIRTGVVVDYLNCLFINFPVFNFADVCICVGVGLLALSLLLDMRREQKAKQQKGSAPTDGTA